ncbi:MAG: glycosyltransferase [Planctomycetes bacterium]|nr:glycosyltransferase [Planctomycetota bacterium]
MKILHLVHNFPPEFTGGTELFVAHVARVQAAAGHDVVVVAGTDARDPECRPVEQTCEGLRVVRLRRFPRPLVLMSDTYDPLLLRALRGVVARERPEVAHVHHWFNLSTSCVVVLAEMGVPAALSFHDLFAVCPRFFRYREDGRCTRPTSLEPCAACCDEDYPFPEWERGGDHALRAEEIARDAAVARRHLFPSAAHRDTLAPLLGSRPEQVEVIPHGVLPIPGTVPPRPALPEAFSAARPLRLGYWGNLVRAKGIPQLLEAAARLVAAGLFVRVDLWGKALDPGLEAEIEVYRARLPLEHHRDFTREALAGIRARVDLACFVSALEESYSFTVDEAAFLGIPVLVSDRGAPRERVGRGGRIVPAEDVWALESAIRELYEDSRALAAMGAAVTRPPPVARAGERLLEVYEAILAGGPVAPPPPLDPRPRLEHWFKKLCARENWLHEAIRERDARGR